MMDFSVGLALFTLVHFPDLLSIDTGYAWVLLMRLRSLAPFFDSFCCMPFSFISSLALKSPVRIKLPLFLIARMCVWMMLNCLFSSSACLFSWAP